MSASPAPPHSQSQTNGDVEMSNPSAEEARNTPATMLPSQHSTAGAGPVTGSAAVTEEASAGPSASASASGSGNGIGAAATGSRRQGDAKNTTLRNPSPLLKREEEDSKKDRSLAELLGMLDGYRPVIPEEVTEYYLQRSGFESHDPRINRLISISAEKFISDIVSDAYQYSRIRSNATSGRPPAANSSNAAGASSGGGPAGGASAGGSGAGVAGGDRSRTVLTMDDLTAALGEYGVNARRADSYR